MNLTARLTSNVDDAEELYAELSQGQRGSYNSLIATGEHTIVSCSPELFFSLDGDCLTARPMKGTFDAELLTKTLQSRLDGLGTPSRVRVRLSRDGIVDISIDDLPPVGRPPLVSPRSPFSPTT